MGEFYPTRNEVDADGNEVQVDKEDGTKGPKNIGLENIFESLQEP